jgi:hypothetical protein
MTQPAGRFRKKPVEIEAMPFDGTEASANEILSWIGTGASYRRGSNALFISTLEGEMTASEGDWIIKGVQGEFYPCKPSIFAATYEPAEDDDD